MLKRYKNKNDDDDDDDTDYLTYTGIGIVVVCIIVLLVLLFIPDSEFSNYIEYFLIKIGASNLLHMIQSKTPSASKTKEPSDTIETEVDGVCDKESACGKFCIKDPTTEICMTDSTLFKSKCLKTDFCSKGTVQNCCDKEKKCNTETGTCTVCPPEQAFGDLCCPKGETGVNGQCCKAENKSVDENGKDTCCPTESIFTTKTKKTICCRTNTKYNALTDKCQPMCADKFFDIDTQICATENGKSPTILNKSCPWKDVITYTPGNIRGSNGRDILLFSLDKNNKDYKDNERYLFENNNSLSASADVEVDSTKITTGCNLTACNAHMSTTNSNKLDLTKTTQKDGKCSVTFLPPKEKLTKCPVSELKAGTKCCLSNGVMTGKICFKEKDFCSNNTCYSGYKYNIQTNMCSPDSSFDNFADPIQCLQNNTNAYCRGKAKPSGLNKITNGKQDYCDCNFGYYGKRCQWDFTGNDLWSFDSSGVLTLNKEKLTVNTFAMKQHLIIVPPSFENKPTINISVQPTVTIIDPHGYVAPLSFPINTPFVLKIVNTTIITDSNRSNCGNLPLGTLCIEILDINYTISLTIDFQNKKEYYNNENKASFNLRTGAWDLNANIDKVKTTSGFMMFGRTGYKTYETSYWYVAAGSPYINSRQIMLLGTVGLDDDPSRLQVRNGEKLLFLDNN